MKYKVIKLDKRYNGHGFYKYAIIPSIFEYWQSREDFKELRNWCWATYGPGAELGWTRGGDKHWAWDTENGNKRLYLKSDAELTLFKLKFSN